MAATDKTKKFWWFPIVGILIIAGAVSFGVLYGSEENSIGWEVEDPSEGNVKTNALVISEISSTATGSVIDPTGHTYDYIELYNGTEKEIDLSYYGLSDSEKEIKWVFPNNTVIAPKSYLIVWCCGKEQDGMYANFKLSGGGEEVVSLRKGSGKVVDAVRTVALEKGQVMARNQQGEWVIQTVPTPGFENTQEGYEAYQESMKSGNEVTNDLVIYEYLPKNDGNFCVNGVRSGFIEIKNTGTAPIDLGQYSLSNDASKSYLWQFPNRILQPGEIVAVFTSGKSDKVTTLQANFKLEATSGQVVLSYNRGGIVQVLEYQNVPDGVAMAYIENGYYRTCSPSPGYENTAEGIRAFHETLTVDSELIISEAMNNNYKYLAQNGGNYYDWIEIKNVTNHEVSLTDYYLSDSSKNIQKVSLGDDMLQPGECRVYMASGNTKFTSKNYIHLPFKLSDMEGIYLAKGDEVVDSLFVGDLPNGYSIGKNDKGAIEYYSEPTPKEANKSGSVAVSTKPVVSQTSTVADGVDSLTITIDGPGTIYYTTNGARPTASSSVYKGPITVTKNKVISVMCKEDGKIKSAVQTYTYIVNQNHTLPIVSITIDPSKLTALHNHAWTEGYEVGAGNIELIENGESRFSEPMGLQLFGGSARGVAKKCYEVVFRKKYGAGHVESAIFDNRESAVYQNFVLRTGSQDESEAVIRDIMGTSLMDEYTDVDVQAYKAVVLYMNGKYRGVYFIREKVDEYFVANHYNVEATKSNTDIVRIDGTYKSGNKKKYNKLVNFINSHDMSKKENYEFVKTLINVENACDYWIGIIWSTNNDMVNCRVFANPYIDDGRFHYIFYDLDCAYYWPTNNFFTFTTNAGGMTDWHYPTTIFRGLMQNSSFRKTFLERLSWNLKNTWSTKTVNAKLDELYNLLKTEMKRDRKYWGHNYDYWKQCVDELKTFAKQRNKYIKSQAKAYFHLSDAEYKKYFG